MDQIVISILSLVYSLIILPVMAIIAVAYYRKNRTKGGMFFSIGAVAAAIGSLFNKFFPKHLFVDQVTGSLSPVISAFALIALVIHFVGLIILVAAWGCITFSKKNRADK